MSAVNPLSTPLCTPAEIAEKRRIAEERQRQNKLKRKADQNNNENRLPLDTKHLASTKPALPGLTEEQRAKIEQNRQEAIRRKLANGLISDQTAAEQLAKKTQPALSPPALSPPAKSATTYLKPQNTAHGSAVQPSAVASSLNTNQVKLLAQTVAPSKSFVAGARVTPYQAKKPVKCFVKCKVEFISEDRFVVLTNTFNELIIKEFKKIASKCYNQTTKTWSFNIADYDELMKLLGSANSDKLAVHLEQVPSFVLKLLKRETSNVNENCLDSMDRKMFDQLYDCQKTAVAYGISKGGRFLLADDMGLGKTRVALAVADYYKNNWPLLIVTTASSRAVWSKEIRLFLPHIMVQDIRTIDSHKDSLLNAKIVICSYSAMGNNMKQLKESKFGVVIFDESHALKNPETNQTKNATVLGHTAVRTILVTGTPALSAPVELFTQLNIIENKFAPYNEFTVRYCDGKLERYGWQAKGCTNPKELEVLLRKNFMIRRLKSEVLGCLEGKTRETVELAHSIDQGMKDMADEYNNATASKDQILKWYLETGMKKKDDVCRYLEAKLQETDEKILIFGHHRCVLDAISDCLTRKGVLYIRIDGTTAPKIRTDNVESFQYDPNIRCAVLSIGACKEGITLTAATIVIFAELDWTPSNLLQAEGRAHRIGQTRPVKVVYLIAPGSADDIMWRKLETKQRNLDSLGLGSKDERLGRNTSTTFRGTATTSGTKHIPDYFQPDTSARSNSPQEFFTCETTLPEDVGSAANKELQDSQDSQYSQIDLQAIMEIEKNYVAQKNLEKNAQIVMSELEGVDFSFLDDDNDDLLPLSSKT